MDPPTPPEAGAEGAVVKRPSARRAAFLHGLVTPEVFCLRPGYTKGRLPEDLLRIPIKSESPANCSMELWMKFKLPLDGTKTVWFKTC